MSLSLTVGFNLEDFDNIITSGDVSHTLLKNNAPSLGCSNWDMLSNLIAIKRQKVFVFGSGDNDESYCTSAGWTLAPIEDADLIVARGTFTINDGATIVSKNENEEEYWKVMESSMMVAAQKKVPMLVTNPDKIRPDASRNPMPGSIGDTYERFLWCSHCPPMGSMSEEDARTYVKRIGKPFQEVYDIALNGSEVTKAIMIGDALETDVTGGNLAGCSTLWVVKNGIHNVDSEQNGEQSVLDGFNSNSYATYAYGKRVAPGYIVDHFQW
jgi:ribonucleotide monophosphatase NagD (HAD superfamily)